MIKEIADKDPLVFISKIHILSLKLTHQKGAKIDDVTGEPRNHVFLSYNGNNYYIRMNLGILKTSSSKRELNRHFKPLHDVFH